MPPTPSLDHLILFLPSTPTKTPLIPPSLSKSFTLTPGGTHADNLTANTLILLRDGCYIELITFITPDPTAIAKHWWGPSPDRTGWTDWCLTTRDSAQENHARVKATHAAPREGGRTRPDGTQVRWAVTFPEGEKGGQARRGGVPFFCHDLTPRDARVPLSEEKTEHPSGVLGVREISVVVRDQELLEELSGVYAAITGSQGAEKEGGRVFLLSRVEEVEGLDEGARLFVRLAKDDAEKAKVEKRGFWYGDVVLAAKAREGKEVGQKERIDEGQDDVGGLWIAYE